MQSLRSRLFVLVLKNRSLLRFQRSKQFVFDRNTFLPELRKKIEDGAGFFGKLPAGFTIEQNTIENLYTEWILPPQATKGKVILYFHGGGYVTGSCQSHRAIVAKFVKGSGIGAFLFDYRLAPEHPFPAALNDATAAYRWLLDQGIDPQHIAFMGDSAGGGLCLATLLALRDQGIPTPASAVALSPWTDLKNTGESLTSNRNKDQLSWIVEPPSLISDYYRGNNDSANPWISPLYGDLHGLPPLVDFCWRR